MLPTAMSRGRPSFSTRIEAALLPTGDATGGGSAEGASPNGVDARSRVVVGAPGAAGPAAGGAALTLRGPLESGTSERRKAPDTPNATTVASSASVLRDSADSAPMTRDTS